MLSYIRIVLLSVLSIFLVVLVRLGYVAYHMRPCDSKTSLAVTNGTLLVDGGLSFEGITYEPGEYFYEDDGSISVCPLSYCREHKKTCVRKCCRRGQSIGYDGCVDGPERALTLENMPMHDDGEGPAEDPELEMYYGHPCEFAYAENFTITRSGLLKEPGGDYYRNIHEYCIDLYKDDVENVFYSWICFPIDESKPGLLTLYPMFRYVVVVSIACYFLTFLVYAALPQLRRNRRDLQGLCLINHIACLSVGYSVLMTTYFANGYSSVSCKMIGYTFYYGFLAGFLWMNVLCFDIWWTSWSARTDSGLSRKRFTNTRIGAFYLLYAYGNPLILAVILYWMDNYGLHEDNRFKPDFGHADKTCFINKRDASWLYFYGPLSIIVLLNTILFIDTAHTISSLTANVEAENHENDRRRHTQILKKLKLYLKLFILMGVTWISEIVSFYLDDSTTGWVIIMDIINNLRGVFLFLILVCNRSVLQKLKTRLGRTPDERSADDYSDTDVTDDANVLSLQEAT